VGAGEAGEGSKSNSGEGPEGNSGEGREPGLRVAAEDQSRG
jgi:hypothetical protein